MIVSAYPAMMSESYKNLTIMYSISVVSIFHQKYNQNEGLCFSYHIKGSLHLEVKQNNKVKTFMCLLLYDAGFVSYANQIPEFEPGWGSNP